LAYNSVEKKFPAARCLSLAPATEEATLFNPFLLLSAAFFLVLSPAPTPGAMPQEAAATQAPVPAKSHVKPTAEAQARAKKLYAVDCAVCHGDTGNGKTDLAASLQLKVDDWTNPASLAGKTDEDLFKTIRNGKDKMPAEAEGRAKDDDVWNMIVYIRGMSKNQPAAPAPSAQ
jgi:mono/diheme cytochrome c family protein